MNNKNLTFHSFLAILVVAFIVANSFGAERSDRRNRLQKGSGTTVTEYQNFDGNRINNIMGNNGQYVSHVVTGNSGMEWPKGTFKLIDFAAGVWVAGLVNDTPRTAAAEYAVEFAPGIILPSGLPDDPSKPEYKWYKIDREDLEAALDYDETTVPKSDYRNWPFNLGAPALPKADGSGDSLDPSGSRIPGLLGDQMLWCVFNDADPTPHANVFSSPPIGVEVQMTVWGYNRTDAFGDMMFVKALLIHKGTQTLDSAFIALWDDPDLGDAADDYVGCDTSLSLGYCWNGDNVDATYRPLAPPAIGRDFFQGPIVPSPGDTAYVSGRRIPGYRNLGMYAFARYTNGATYPDRDPESAIEVYRYMNGTRQDGSPFINPLTNQPTRYVFTGDPETGVGWTEINPTINAVGDRRFLMSSGPFTFAPGDTQEVVFGVLIARGTNFRNSVTTLKRTDIAAQSAYNANFRLPPSPPAPNVTKVELDREIVLYWQDNAESYVANDLIGTRKFEGYIVYQLDAEAGYQDARRIAVFDLDNDTSDIRDWVYDDQRGEYVEVTVVRGTDEGVQRSISIKTDAYTGLPLSNSRTYYFAVASYGMNPDGDARLAVPRAPESALRVLRCIPTSPPPGTRYNTSYGNAIPVTHIGPGDGGVIPLVVDPKKVTGHEYKVVFREDTTGTVYWSLLDSTLNNTVVLADQTNQTGDGRYQIVDGIQVKVTGPSLDLKGIIETANSGGPHAPTQGAFLFNDSGFPSVIPCDPVGPPCDRPAANPEGARWGIHTGAGGIGGDYHYPLFRSRVFRNDNFDRFIPYDWEIRFTATGGLAYLAFTTGAIINVPFELWNVGIDTPNDPSDDYRCIPLIFDANGNGAFGLDSVDHPISGGDNDPETDWIYFYQPIDLTPGSAGYNLWAANPADSLIGDEVMARLVLVNFNGGSISDPNWPNNVNQLMPPTGTVFRIVSTKPNSSLDVFAFSTANLNPTYNLQTAKSDINLINVVPNPYFASQIQERDPLNRFVTFTRLPEVEKTTIRIFTVSGIHVRTIEHTPGRTWERWDLRNSAGLPVASGMYIVHIEVEGLGSKVLKLGVIQPEERLDRL